MDDVTKLDPVDLYDFDMEGLVSQMKTWGQPTFRAKQLWRQLYVRLADSAESMSDLSQALRETIGREGRFGGLQLKQVFKGDGGLTRKALFTFPDGVAVEAVLMVYPERATVCVSSQAGCPMGCVFCATAKLGHLHDLTAGMIVQQVLWAARELTLVREEIDWRDAKVKRHRVNRDNFPKRLSNVVYMGMGEPFNNYDPVWRSVERLHDPGGFNLGARSFTISTVGLIPGIEQLAKETLPVNLAISLHTPRDAERSALMPVNRRYPIADLMAAVRAYTAATRRRVSFEYVLLAGKNDREEEADELAELLTKDGPMLCHVNLIPWNPVRDTPLARSSRERVNAFRDRLEKRGVSATIRIQRGVDIDAACGQLAGTT